MIALLLLANAITFFLIGKYIERYRWNILIKNGIIPKPKNK